MIRGVGIDLIEVERVRRAAGKESFLRRVFTEQERDYYTQQRDNPQTLAGIFAAKEAVAKARSTGLAEGVCWQEIEICHRESGQPYIRLTGGAKEQLDRLGGTRVHVSISHIKSMAVAQAVIEDA